MREDGDLVVAADAGDDRLDIGVRESRMDIGGPFLRRGTHLPGRRILDRPQTEVLQEPAQPQLVRQREETGQAGGGRQHRDPVSRAGLGGIAGISHLVIVGGGGLTPQGISGSRRSRDDDPTHSTRAPPHESEALSHENAHRLVATDRTVGTFLVPGIRFAAVRDVTQSLVQGARPGVVLLQRVRPCAVRGAGSAVRQRGRAAFPSRRIAAPAARRAATRSRLPWRPGSRRRRSPPADPRECIRRGSPPRRPRRAPTLAPRGADGWPSRTRCMPAGPGAADRAR